MPDHPPVDVGTRVAIGDNVYEFRLDSRYPVQPAWCRERTFQSGKPAEWDEVQDFDQRAMLNTLAARLATLERADLLLLDAAHIARITLLAGDGAAMRTASLWLQRFTDYRLCPTTPPPSPSTPSP